MDKNFYGQFTFLRRSSTHKKIHKSIYYNLGKRESEIREVLRYSQKNKTYLSQLIPLTAMAYFPQKQI